MKIRNTLLIVGLLLTTLAFPSAAAAAPEVGPVADDVVIFGQEYILAEGEVLDGSLVAFGSEVTIGAGATVEGDVVLFGSQIDVLGTIDGNLVGFGTDIMLETSGVVHGDLIAPGSSWNRDTGAQIDGDVISELGPFNVDLDNLFDFDSPSVSMPQFFDSGIRYNPGWSLLWMLLRTLAISTIALLFVLFLPEHTDRLSQTILGQPVVSGGIGLLGLVVSVIGIFLLAITICLSPFALLWGLLLVIATIFGWSALGMEVGARLMDAMKADWSPFIQAWVGTFLLSLVVGLIGLVPCIGWIAGFFIGMLGLGAAILTRFGTRPYPLMEAELVEAESEE